MGRYTRKLKHRKTYKTGAAKRHTGSSRAASGAASPRRGSRAASESFGIRLARTVILFLRRNAKWVAAGALVLAAGIVCLILFTGKDRQVSVTQPSATPSLSAAATTDYTVLESYAYEDVDEDTLAGLAGTDEDMFSDDPEMEAALLEAEGLRIGVTVQSLPSSMDEALLGRLEMLAAEAQQSKRIYRTYYYNARGNAMQQIQDVRSLLNNEVDVILIGPTDAENFAKVCYMAQEAGIPVVAYDAPAAEGYAVNIVTDQKAWGKVYGDFVAQQLPEGNVLCVLGSAESAIDQQRAEGITTALASNSNLKLLDPVYASWKRDKAHDAVEELLDDHTRIDAVIVEEGMAEGVLNAFIEAEKFPAVMCGDVTAGFIQKWHALKVTGLPVEDPDADEDAEPTPTPMLLFAPEGTLTVCAQPSPLGAGALAFEIAVRMAEGRVLKAQGETITCPVQIYITSENLAQYYNAVKDSESTAFLTDVLPEDMIEALFEPAPVETPAPTATPQASPTVQPTPTGTAAP